MSFSVNCSIKQKYENRNSNSKNSTVFRSSQTVMNFKIHKNNTSIQKQYGPKSPGSLT